MRRSHLLFIVVLALAAPASRAEIMTEDVPCECINYPEALHGFTNPTATAKGEEFGIPIAYQKEADEASWAKLQSFFEEIFQ